MYGLLIALGTLVIVWKACGWVTNSMERNAEHLAEIERNTSPRKSERPLHASLNLEDVLQKIRDGEAAKDIIDKTKLGP